MRFRILGALEFFDGTEWKNVTAAKQRTLLATLLINRDGPVTVDRIREQLWGDDSPRGAVNVIQQYVMRLRRTLNDPQGRLLVTRSSAYELRLSAEDVDAWLFTYLESAGRSAQRAGEHARASALFTEALALWRGPALADVQPTLAIEAEIARLTEHRLAVIEARADADLDCGRHAELVPELRSLVNDHPLRERMWGQLMIALYRSGRKAEALQVFRDLHQLMKTELGVEPTEEVQQLHQQILDGNPALDPPRPPAAVRTGDPVPRQLPSGVPSFAGRVAEIRALTGDLVRSEDSPRIVLISGMAGVGKTALALHCAHRLATHFPDGQLYVNLRGYGPSGPPLDAADVIPRFLSVLSVPPEQIPGEPEAQVSLYRSSLAGRRFLILLDNAHSAEQVRSLLPGSPGCSVIVTSRDQLLGLTVTEGATLIGLDVLDLDEARDLLASRLGAERLRLEERAASELIALCGRLPLALAITAARAAARPKLSLATLADQLRARRNLLDALDTGDMSSSVRSVFSWSYQALDAPAAELFRLLGLHPSPEISTTAAASLCGCSASTARKLLFQLSEANLISEAAVERYVCHDLVWAYAGELARQEDPESQHMAARQRVLAHYLQTANRADRQINQNHQIPYDLDPTPDGVCMADIVGSQHAMDWFRKEYLPITGAIAMAAEHGLDTLTWQLVRAFRTFLYRSGHFAEQAELHRLALRSAIRLADSSAQAYCHFGLGQALTRLYRFDMAGAELSAALDLYVGSGDHLGQAVVLTQLSVLHGQQGDLRSALEYSKLSLEHARAAGHRPGQAMALNNVGWYSAQLGDHESARRLCEEALELLRSIGDVVGEAATLDSLGYIHRSLEQHEEAVSCYQQALLLRRGQEPVYEAETLPQLAEAQLSAGAPAEARKTLRRALSMVRQFAPYDAMAVQARLEELERLADPECG